MASIVRFGSYDNGMDEFNDTGLYGRTGVNGDYITVHTTGGPNNKPWARYYVDLNAHAGGSSGTESNSTQGFSGNYGTVGMGVGNSFWYGVSTRVPSTSLNTGIYYGIGHHQSSQYGTTNPAPLNAGHDSNADGWRWVVRGNTLHGLAGEGFKQTSWGPRTGDILYSGVPNGKLPILTDTWVHWRYGTLLKDDGTGWFELWYRSASMSSWVNVIPRKSNIYTCYNNTDYPVLTIYTGTALSGTQVVQLDYSCGAFCTDETTLANWQDQRLGFTGTANPAPTISSFSPTSGAVGNQVTITGTNLDGTTAVSFNGTAATFTNQSSTSVLSSVPSGATSGTISVTTPNGSATSSGSFTVTVPVTNSIGYTAIGAKQFTGYSNDYKRACIYSAPEAATVTDGYAYLGGGSTATSVRIVLYSVTAGQPDALLGVSDDVSIPAAQAASWVHFPFTNHVSLSNGQQVAIGMQYNGPHTLAYDATGTMFMRLDSFADGASNPWTASEGGGFTGSYNDTISVYVTYTSGGGDTTPPTITAQSVASSTLTLVASEALDDTSVPAASAFAVIKNGAGDTVNSVAVSGTNVTLTLANAFTPGDSGTVAYTQPVSGQLKDVAGNLMASFTAQTLTNNSSSRVGNPELRISVPGSLALLDDFAQAGTPQLPWNETDGLVTMQIVNGSMVNGNQLSTGWIDMQYLSSFPADQGSYAVPDQNATFNIYARYDFANKNGYYALLDSTDQLFGVIRRDAGVDTTLAYVPLVNFTPGTTKLGIACVGSLILALQDNAIVCSATDTTYTSGDIGVGFYGQRSIAEFGGGPVFYRNATGTKSGTGGGV